MVIRKNESRNRKETKDEQMGLFVLIIGGGIKKEEDNGLYE